MTVWTIWKVNKNRITTYKTIVRHSFQQPSKPYASKSKCVRWRAKCCCYIAHTYIKILCEAIFVYTIFDFILVVRPPFPDVVNITTYSFFFHTLWVLHTNGVELTIFNTIRLIRFLLICNFIANVLPLNVCNPKIVAKMK